MQVTVTVLPQKRNIAAAAGDNLLSVLRSADLAPDAPCGGGGRCGKCRVWVDGVETLACRTTVERDLTVTLPGQEREQILTEGICMQDAPGEIRDGFLLAFDIGTTTVVGYLLDGTTGRELACESRRNPQAAFGADVISRIQHARSGQMDAMTACIRWCVTQITEALCEKARVESSSVTVVCVVGNPAMQQLFLGIPLDNLAQIPFAPVLTRSETVRADTVLPIWEAARLRIVPDISGFVGADALACVLATGLDRQEGLSLMIDIGTNAEMVMGNRHHMVACSAAAGPALEGAGIQFGMRGQPGAVDHVWIENGERKYSVIGGGEAVGICGSGLIDAVAAALEEGLLNSRGRIQTRERILPLTDRVWLTQEDIRQVQMAKGAIAAGIMLMAEQLGVSLEQIENVYLAGAFGTFLNPESACRIGLLPPALRGKTKTVGNAAGSGAKRLTRDEGALADTDALISRIEFIELAAIPDFSRCFAKHMRF